MLVVTNATDAAKSAVQGHPSFCSRSALMRFLSCLPHGDCPTGRTLSSRGFSRLHAQCFCNLADILNSHWLAIHILHHRNLEIWTGRSLAPSHAQVHHKLQIGLVVPEDCFSLTQCNQKALPPHLFLYWPAIACGFCLGLTRHVNCACPVIQVLGCVDTKVRQDLGWWIQCHISAWQILKHLDVSPLQYLSNILSLSGYYCINICNNIQ